MAEPIIQDASENTPPVAIVEAPQDAPATRTEDVDLSDVDVEVHAKWWGYELVLNQPAVEKLSYSLNNIQDLLAEIIKPLEIRAIVVLCLAIKQVRLRRVSYNTGNQGCRLISPWICPVALTVVRKKADADLSLYTSVWDPSDHKFGEESPFTDIESACGPALAQYRDRLYCVYRGKGDDYNMYWMTYTSDDGWSDGSAEDEYPENQRPKQFPAHKTEQNAALVVYKDILYCIHRGGHNDEALWFCTFDIQNNTWTKDTRIEINGVFSKWGPSAVVFNDKLYVFFAANYYGNEIAYVSWDGHTWSSFATISDGCDGNNDKHLTCDTPAVAVYGDKLYVAHRGSNNEILYYCIGSSNGSGPLTWTPDMELGNGALAEQGPALAVFKDKLVMIHRSSTNNALLLACYYDGKSWSADTLFGHDQITGDTPALVSYMDPNATTDNYVDPNNAGPSLIAVYRGS
jgi:hypothetical protein